MNYVGNQNENRTVGWRRQLTDTAHVPVLLLFLNWTLQCHCSNPCPVCHLTQHRKIGSDFSDFVHSVPHLTEAAITSLY